ncbi:MAG: hypothetical protein M1820_008815 [Bogoriella megaspora]|nr:MAG: hypothetical protein M1820_008815 [Bogoriella megaspora]
MKNLLNKAKQKVDQLVNQNTGGLVAAGHAGGLGSHLERNLHDGSNSAAHGGGGCPNFDSRHLKNQHPLVPQPGHEAPGPGQLPPKVAKTTYHDRHKFFHPKGYEHDTLRDLGFTGVLDGRIIWTFGDTLMGTEERCMICAVDSTSIGTMDAPMCSLDSALQPNGEFVRNWIPCNEEEENDGGLVCYAFGGTNVIEISPNRGLVFYLKNHRPGGVQTLKGAGIATCYIGEDNVPHAQRVGEKLWTEQEPCWGDVGAVYNAQDGYVYAYGHGPQRDSELISRTFLARAPAHQATDVKAYEYWKNKERIWTRRRQGNGANDMDTVSHDDAIFGWYDMNQSVPFWSNYYNIWMFLHSTGWPVSEVQCKTAERLEGPWFDHGTVATTQPEGHGEGMRYCVTAHPEFDPSGKMVFVTWTRNNVIWGVTIEWE